MPRANRFYLPGHIWHITHCCHNKGFLLQFAKDRKRWLRWSFEARKRFGLCSQLHRYFERYPSMG